ncbi:MFS multidrug transporter-like protein [Ascodesmis nigricans]|uniref:MFS multidrug transporter-like protein n=1 Tax=Ascodesmis nigricans TaxID=341454 RepID=A0A4S2MWF8_9PEZI|nr:MFS multidrug transporter-like protein [Ascodesmis nigricans]
MPSNTEEKARPSTPSRQPSINSTTCDFMDKAEIQRLGRVRPEVFKSAWSEVGFVLSICMAQILVEYFVSGFNVLVPTIVKALNISSTSSTWPASAFSLVLAGFLLPMGRLADMYGGKRMFVIGIGWLVIWSVVAGLAQNELLVVFARGLQGLGPAAFLPSSVMLLGSIYRPGPRKNLVFSLYGACAPLGFFIGIFFAGVSAQYLNWRWYFFIGAGWTALSFFLAWASMPSDKDERAAFGIKMDWIGTVLIVSGLILVVYALTDCGHTPQGWRAPQIPITFCAGIIILGIAVWWEGWMAEQPLLPVDIFKVKMFPAVVGAMFTQYGGLGIFLLYSAFYMEIIMKGTPMQIVVWTTPMCVGGIIIATVGGLVLHLVSGTVLMLIAGVSWVIAPLLFAIMPRGASYWAFVFPAMITGTIGIDISFNITNIFITTGLPKRQQGLAGAIINSNMHLSIAFFLGIADVLAGETRKTGATKLQQLRYVFWFEVALASVALIIMMAFVRLDSAKSDMTADEKEQFRVNNISGSTVTGIVEESQEAQVDV